jgi:FlaA1/EpsC-like NDP-sugar epimerase
LATPIAHEHSATRSSVRPRSHDLPLVLLDAALVLGGYLGALVLRFDGAVPERYWRNFWTFVPLVVVIHLLVNRLVGLYGKVWRYASIQEARRVILAGAVAGTVIAGAGSLLATHPLPIGALLIGATLSFIASGAVRFRWRLLPARPRHRDAKRSRVLLVGAGDAEEAILRDLQRNPTLGLDPVAVVDDDLRKLGRVLHGVRVLGTRGDIRRLVHRLKVDRVVLAAPSATRERVHEVAALCEQADVTLCVFPSLREALGGRTVARVTDLGDLRAEDLLGRKQVSADLDSVAGLLRDRRVLVTGAGGSIGSEIVRQVLMFAPGSLVLLDHDETHLHDLLVELDPARGGSTVNVLADIRDHERILATFLQHRPEVVFHAAAHKHVPVLESHPEEALLTNVIGTANVADAALRAGTERFVLVSTDKAIHPVNVMGASKWLAEQLMWSLDASGCVFCAVRFGNVLGSRGSVIPTFRWQIERGGPVTVTDPAMTRYFMSVQEAVQLVLQAATLSSGGEMFTLDMGRPMSILDLAKRMIRLSGQVPGKDVEISFVGTRPGEKLREDITNPAEESVPSEHPAIVVSRPLAPDRATLRRVLTELEVLAADQRSEELASAIKCLPDGRLAPGRSFAEAGSRS